MKDSKIQELHTSFLNLTQTANTNFDNFTANLESNLTNDFKNVSTDMTHLKNTTTNLQNISTNLKNEFTTSFQNTMAFNQNRLNDLRKNLI